MKLRLLATSLIGAALMAACGGSDDDRDADTGRAATCSVPDRKAWLRDYMADWYFWYKLSPSPDPTTYFTVDDYFGAALAWDGVTALISTPHPTIGGNSYQGAAYFYQQPGTPRPSPTPRPRPTPHPRPTL